MGCKETWRTPSFIRVGPLVIVLHFFKEFMPEIVSSFAPPYPPDPCGYLPGCFSSAVVSASIFAYLGSTFLHSFQREMFVYNCSADIRSVSGATVALYPYPESTSLLMDFIIVLKSAFGPDKSASRMCYL